MKRIYGILIGAVLLGMSGQASAVVGTIDDVPAATLLLPYFEVDLERPDGITTLFSINNAAAEAVLAHVTIWTDQSAPALDFDVYLTGFDVQTVNLRDVLVNGVLPVTASDTQDPADVISPQGTASQDVGFASCAGILPYTQPAISPSFRTHLQSWLTGRQSPITGDCAGARIRDGIARGYVTIDAVNACNLLFPASPGYSALLTNQNVLWGDVFYVNPQQSFAQGETLVAIEACANCFVPGDHTFYGRYNGGQPTDRREPLPTTMVTRFLNGGAFTGGTDLFVWREAGPGAGASPCALHGPPAWYPLESYQITVFDEEENPVVQGNCPSGATCGELILIPNEAQRVSVREDLLSPFDFGWVYLNLQHTAVVPTYGDFFAQAWVMAVMDAEGRFSVGFDAIQLDNANRPITTLIPVG